jgi:hypothetical protein
VLKLSGTRDALQGLGYEVALYAHDADMPAAKAFMRRAKTTEVASMDHVVLVNVHERGVMLRAPPVKVFVHTSSTGLPRVFGHGAANILVVPSLAPDSSSSSSGTAGSRPASRVSPGSQAAALALATYDYVLYTSNAGYVAHIPHIMPILEQLQLQSKMFPLVDILPLPAPPVQPKGSGDTDTAAAAATTTAEKADSTALGVTLSMSVYKAGQRPVLTQALTAFAALAARAATPPRLILCSWLMPGAQLHALHSSNMLTPALRQSVNLSAMLIPRFPAARSHDATSCLHLQISQCVRM